MITNNQFSLEGNDVIKLIENENESGSLEVIIKNNQQSIWVGGTEDVSNHDGFIIKAFETLKVTLSPGDAMYAYSIKNTRVHVLSTEV